MNEQQAQQMLQLLASSNHYHKITYQKLELISLVLLQVVMRAMPYLNKLGGKLSAGDTALINKLKNDLDEQLKELV